MSKIKTNKSAAKRFRVSGKGKLMRRPVKQNHYNARDTGNETRRKKGYKGLTKDEDKNIRKVLPYI
ncbi:MAG: 50S ribosomal protein L35 [Candidatus Yanofskybacteria bacterium RIFCSPLOWO2_02_FULL_45_10]|uniref:Large ribosomal subunit protein bL35 n=2 Tax=Candidatus Yanofskyibacteriota TaxID=1752733 RepID=A0A1F8G761_9BACT|nr:MAG: 50S ribosomal protein L35 [Candidatus Yanofskybacteria bacterium RIFCSPHIGHO2_12_FULL_45_19b]OGN31907.1 MAG: 50S ribosomal protein L35 [Candidatus Yanofskybacteria bacterium RIFCSPLOWO2_02_FULL_45_10]HCM45653.1 50S ribosomal protein L35 [Candidatus Veblenbacteria bacterium]